MQGAGGIFKKPDGILEEVGESFCGKYYTGNNWNWEELLMV